MEIKPGHHEIEVVLYREDIELRGETRYQDVESDRETVQVSIGIIKIEPHGVYVLSGYITSMKNYKFDGYEYYPPYASIIKVANKYNQGTGVVSDPTDSKFSIRIKK